VTLDLHAEALGAADVDVVLRQIHAVASHAGALGWWLWCGPAIDA